MTSKGRKISLAIGMVIFTAGLIGPLGPVGIGLGIGLVIGSQRRKKDTDEDKHRAQEKAKRQAISRSRAMIKKHMTAEESNQLISVILPVVTNNK